MFLIMIVSSTLLCVIQEGYGLERKSDENHTLCGAALNEVRDSYGNILSKSNSPACTPSNSHGATSSYIDPRLADNQVLKTETVPEQGAIGVPVVNPSEQIAVPTYPTPVSYEFVEKKIPYAVEKLVYYKVEKMYPIKVEKFIPYPVVSPYAIYVPVYKHLFHRRASPRWMH